MQFQHRRYQLKPGTRGAFTAVWQDQVVPLRRRFGFEVVGAWASSDPAVFAWVMAHPGDFAEAEAEYYAAPERAALDPNPGDLIERSDVEMVDAVEIPAGP